MLLFAARHLSAVASDQNSTEDIRSTYVVQICVLHKFTQNTKLLVVLNWRNTFLSQSIWIGLFIHLGIRKAFAAQPFTSRIGCSAMRRCSIFVVESDCTFTIPVRCCAWHFRNGISLAIIGNRSHWTFGMIQLKRAPTACGCPLSWRTRSKINFLISFIAMKWFRIGESMCIRKHIIPPQADTLRAHSMGSPNGAIRFVYARSEWWVWGFHSWDRRQLNGMKKRMKWKGSKKRRDWTTTFQHTYIRDAHTLRWRQWRLMHPQTYLCSLKRTYVLELFRFGPFFLSSCCWRLFRIVHAQRHE